MYNLKLKGGLLYASVVIGHEGRSVTVDDVIIDTGAYHTFIQSDYLE